MDGKAPGPIRLSGYGSSLLNSSCSHAVASALLDRAYPKEKCFLIPCPILNKEFCSPHLHSTDDSNRDLSQEYLKCLVGRKHLVTQSLLKESHSDPQVATAPQRPCPGSPAQSSRLGEAIPVTISGNLGS